MAGLVAGRQYHVGRLDDGGDVAALGQAELADRFDGDGGDEADSADVVGVQVMGGKYTELRCLAVAEAIERLLGPLTPIDPVAG